MAEIELAILGPTIYVVKWVAAPIKRQFNYLCCFTSNIKDLQVEAENLDVAKDGLQMKVDRANDNVQPILPEVLKWLKDYDDIIRTMTEITNDVPRVETGCWKLPARYRLSRKVKKKTARVKELREEQGKFRNVAEAGQPPAREELPTLTAYHHFKSRKHIEDGIMTALRGEDYNMIGICGMGGAGKTAMAVEIMNKLREEKVVDELVKVVITQQVDKLKTQNKVAGSLGLKFEEGEVQQSRVQKLRARLAPPRRVLLLLDDVWERLELEELGIPFKNGSPGCKVLVTSRDTKVLAQMEMGKVFKLEALSEEESWILFRGKVGACVDGAELKPMAKEVMRQCGGLPVALAAVGGALKDENEASIWEDALEQLKSGNPPAGKSDMSEKVHNPLKLSYDLLDNYWFAKSLFLLCCLFPEDYNIPLEDLTYFAMGLHLFKDIHELEDVRNRTRASVKMLKNRCLLLDGSDEDHVRMHDVVRNVSTYIASKVEKRVKCRSSCTTCTGTCTCPCTCTWISSHVDGGARHVSKEESCFPELKLLWMNNKVEQEMDNIIGGSTIGLNVLFIEYGLLKSLPLIISLTTLVLLRCDSLESIAVVGQLESLEILICCYCRSIKEFPEQVRGLKHLKLLEISRCEKLKRITAGVISSMVALEELKIVDSFNDWKGGEIDEERNDEANLREIESLKKLRCLNIDVSDIALAAQPLRLSFDKLVQFTVRFGKIEYVFGGNYHRSYQRTMYLCSRDKSDIIDFGDLSANIFLTRTECLYARAEHNQDFNLNLAKVQNIRWLNLECFTNKKNITSAASFSLLEYLRLVALCNLEEIWDDAPIPSNSFNNLKHLQLVVLESLKRMGKCVLSTANDFFLQLESIKIEYCKKIEHLLVLVPNEEEQEKEDDITFSKLKRPELYEVPICSSSSRGIESIQFPLLAEIFITDCNKLKCLVASGDDDHCQDDDDDSLHLFCNPKVSFPSLRRLSLSENTEIKNLWCDQVPIGFFRGLVKLDISLYGKIRSLFSLSSKIPQNLLNLRLLDIGGCDEMVKVMEDDEEVSSSSCDHPTNPTSTLFPSLQVLWLRYLPKLESFCKWRCADLELPSLKTVQIVKCKEMKSFNAAAGSLVITPALRTVRINDKDLEFVDDLNAALHQHFEKPKKHHFHETEEKKPKISVEDHHDDEVYDVEKSLSHDERGELLSLEKKKPKISLEDHHDDEEVYDVEKSLSHDERGELLSLEKKKTKISVEDHHDDEEVYDVEIPKDPTRGVPHEVPKRCIEHCKLFLPDCEFDKDKLVRMWIAEGCIELGVIKRMEDVGNLYFDALAHEEVIVPSKFDNVQRQMKYKFNKPHLVLLEQGQYLRVNASNMDGIHKEVLHLTWQCKRLDRTLSDALKDLKQLRTLVVHEEDCSASISQLPSDIFSGLTLLKTLDLSRTHISELPGSIGKLESLQYLDVSETPIKQLPESLDRLYCLQTLNLRACVGITALPRGFGRLVNLRHLDLDIVSQLKFMPRGMGKLIELQTLQAFIVGKDDGCDIGELKNMNEITGSFCISRLENVINAEEAKEAALCDKKYIDKLELRWRNCGNDSFQDTAEILESLQPHFGLKEFQLTFYGGSKLPRWISNPAYTDLSSMTLYKCINCDTLPSIGELPSLKILSIFDMENVRNIDTVFCRNHENKVFNAFPMLEKLTLDSMPSLEEWTGVEDGDFPCLRHVSLEYCPNLRVLPSLAHLSSLEYFELSNCMQLISLPEGSLPASLDSLIIRGCPGLNESCRKDGGVDWFKIASVRNIWID